MTSTKLMLSITRKALLLSVIFSITLVSCKKDGELFPEFNDENLTIHFTDTFNILTSIIKDDSIRTDFSGANLLGIYHDSIMGVAASSIYTEITLAGANVNFGDNALVDSVVLSMKYLETTSFYGNVFNPMSIEVLRLSEKFTKSEYYSNEDLSSSGFPTPLATLTYTPFMNDSVDVIQNGDTTRQAPHLRILLDNAFGQEILDAGKNGNTIVNNAALKDIVNGLHITTSSNVNNTTLNKGEGSIISFDMNSSLSTVTVFYRNDQGPGKSYSFIINSESKKFNRFSHNYTNTDVEKHLTGVGFDSTVTYVQAMSGVKTKLNIPDIKNLNKDGKIIINKAELIFSINDGSNTTLKAIPNLSLTGINASGEAIFLIDFFEGSTYFGGSYNETSKTYTFNIARHLQDLINNDKTDYGLYLVASGSSVIANRSIINSFKHPSNKIKLNITYSKY